MMPKQRPGKSRQDYQTPKELLFAIKKRLQIDEFEIDLAADDTNAVCTPYITEEMDSLVVDWPLTEGGWCWLNPPFGDIEPWVAKAANASQNGTQVVMLVPASVGANWWRTWVEPYAYVSFLNGRLCFIPDWETRMVWSEELNEFGGSELVREFKSPPLYPKDCAVLLYSTWGFLGHEIWSWK